MFLFRDKIVSKIKEKIINSMVWGEKSLNVSLLILCVDFSFSKKSCVSFVEPDFLKSRIFFSLYGIEQMALNDKKEWFKENNKRTNQLIPSFYGNWEDHCNALVAHELAHVFEFISKFEPFIDSKINQKYGIKKNHGKSQHHNLLWRMIYKDLKNVESFENSKIITIDKSSGFTCYNGE